MDEDDARARLDDLIDIDNRVLTPTKEQDHGEG
jgi:hypothetical protein